MTQPTATRPLLYLGIHQKQELLWYFSFGVTFLESSTAGAMVDTGTLGVLGNGCSVTYAPEPKEENMAKAGYVSAIISRLDAVHARVLALAYGDSGYLATDGGRLPDLRYRAVARLTPVAIRQGILNKRDTDAGDRAQQWLERQWARGAKRTKEITAAEKQARALLDAAEIAYQTASVTKRQERKDAIARHTAETLRGYR